MGERTEPAPDVSREHASMVVEIRADDDPLFTRYAAIAAVFAVRERVDVASLRRGADAFTVRAEPTPWIKRYDALPGNAPPDWVARFRDRPPTTLAAFVAGERVGGAVLVLDDPTIDGVGGRRGCALLWDLRVAPGMRGRGVGRTLLRHAEDAVAAAGRRSIDVETQDVNVPACRLYAEAGYRVREIEPHAYSDLPDETRIVWTKVVRP